MNISVISVFKLLLYFALGLVILSPSLSNLLGVPRLDSVLSFVFFFLSLVTLFSREIEKDFLKLLFPLYALFFFVVISLINNFSPEKTVDSFFFGIVIFLFHYSYLAFNYENGEKGIRYLVLGISLIVLAGFFIEALLGFQLVSGNEELTVIDKAFKGFFFNTNDQAVIMISLAVSVGFFFIIRENNWKVKLTGYVLLLVIGVAIVVSASRSVLLSYLIMLMLILFLNASVYFKAVYLFFVCVIALFIFNLSWLQELFILLAKIDWLERPIERFSLVIFSMADDKSVGYRAEIYTAFLDNFKILWLGYGPRDYLQYFDQIKLSFPLGYTNPHSFFVEVYLAFGIFAFFVFLFFILNSVYYVLTDYLLAWKERIFILFIFINFCWIVWVPSSILRLPLVWYPLFLVLVYAVLVKNGTFIRPEFSRRRAS